MTRVGDVGKQEAREYRRVRECLIIVAVPRVSVSCNCDPVPSVAIVGSFHPPREERLVGIPMLRPERRERWSDPR